MSCSFQFVLIKDQIFEFIQVLNIFLFQHILSDFAEGPYKAKSPVSSFGIDKIENERRCIPSASSALVIGAILGLIQAIFLISGAKPLLNFMGVGSVSTSAVQA